MNLSPAGGFMEGVAKGISGGMQNYARLKQASQEEEQRRDEQAAMYEFKLATDTNIPLAIRKGALESFNARNKKWKTGVRFPTISSEMWDSPDFNKYLKKVKAIQENKDYSLQDKLRFTRGIIAEAEGVLGIEAKALKPFETELQEQAFTKGTAGMLPGGGGAISPEQRGLLAKSTTGRSIVQERMKPVPSPKAPTTPMYKTMDLPGGKTQEMRYNPKTKKHDIPFGKPKTGKEGHYFRLGHNYYQIKDGKSKMIQEGSIDEKATMNAMKEFGWSMMSESDQVALVAKHKRILTGKGRGKSEDDTERTNAKAAIDAGVSLEAVKKLYKKRTGKEY